MTPLVSSVITVALLIFLTILRALVPSWTSLMEYNIGMEILHHGPRLIKPTQILDFLLREYHSAFARS
jgi:hypothetical protein